MTEDTIVPDPSESGDDLIPLRRIVQNEYKRSVVWNQ